MLATMGLVDIAPEVNLRNLQSGVAVYPGNELTKISQ